MHTILLLHGVMSSRIDFRRNQRDLEDLELSVLAMDLPGMATVALWPAPQTR